MELIDGLTLREAGPFTLGQVVQIACQLCNALEHAHSRGIVHRDLKPDNVMLVQVSGRPLVKLMDLGLALARDMPSMTAEDAVIGTALYMAPEQSQGLPVRPVRADRAHAVARARAAHQRTRSGRRAVAQRRARHPRYPGCGAPGRHRRRRGATQGILL